MYNFKKLLNEISNDEIKDIIINKAKLDIDVFNKIMKASGGKSAYTTWLAKHVINKNILIEDIYKYEKYLAYYIKYKNSIDGKKYGLDPNQIKNIHYFKNKSDVKLFEEIIIDLMDNLKEKTGSIENNTSNLLSLDKIRELNEVGIEFLGVVDGYQVFEIPGKIKNNEEAYKTYRKILGQCKDNNHIGICTIASFNHFQRYLTVKPGSSYFVFFNLNDPNAPYQFHYESNQFMNRKNHPIF